MHYIYKYDSKLKEIPQDARAKQLSFAQCCEILVP